MTVFALLRVSPITEDDITPDVAAAIDALEEFDVTYETTPMATTLEADDVHELFAACAAAHEAVDRAHVQTLVQVDDKREVEMTASDKVDAVEGELGRDARSQREE
ncbi:MTH1187 family thiamine-binding protein [Saliphagus sp. GCM10025308]|uniref:Thiamine-binding protein n=1 Tax=Natronosalvus rutilus TaxID=2953753 RepID=A0A9E7NAJ5_9EURY|nr:thiamine-binding protein [Natronosalvus rutilus]UTF53886.1 thiamine-binding protein [Natronosalvus rutilus]